MMRHKASSEGTDPAEASDVGGAELYLLLEEDERECSSSDDAGMM